MGIDLPDAGAGGELGSFEVFDAARDLFVEELVDEGLLGGGGDVEDVIETDERGSAGGVLGDGRGVGVEHVVGPGEGADDPFVGSVQKFGRGEGAAVRGKKGLGGLFGVEGRQGEGEE